MQAFQAALLLALLGTSGVLGRPAPTTTCNVRLARVTLGQPGGSASITCSGPGAPVSIQGPPSLQAVLKGSTGIKFTATPSATALLTFKQTEVTITGSITNCTGGASVLSFVGGAAQFASLAFTGNIGDQSPILAQDTSVTVSKSTFTGNHAGFAGGAIALQGGSLAVVSSRFQANHAAVQGGSISHNATDGSAQATITGSTFSNGVAACFGGAGYFHGVQTVSVAGSSFTNNSQTQVLGNSPGGVCSALQYSLTAGGALYVEKFTASGISDSSFVKNTAANSAVHLTNGGSATLKGSTFTRNVARATATSSAAGYTVESLSDAAIIEASVFTGNLGKSTGAVQVGAVPEAVIEDSTFTNNAAMLDGTAHGGGLCFLGGCSKGCRAARNTFNHNSCSGIGAGLSYNGMEGDSTVRDNVFFNNTCGNTGGGLIFANAQGEALANVINNTFIANSAVGGSATGAGMAVYNSLNANILDSTFTNNSALTGGAIWVEGLAPSTGTYGTNIVLERCRFITNYAANSGGAVDMVPIQSAIVRSCVFEGNSALGGGALYLDGGTGGYVNQTLIYDSTFTNNQAVQEGGAISMQNFYVSLVKNCTFHGNQVLAGTAPQGGTGGTGGAIYVSSILDTAYFVTSTFTQNTAFYDHFAGLAYGGALYATFVNAVAIISSNFLDNVSQQWGGAISNYGTNYLNITASTFKNNTAAVDGGAIYAINVDFGGYVNGSTFTDNTALAGQGGAILLEGSQSPYFITSNTFTRNAAHTGGNGGAIALSANLVSLTIQDNRFDSNSADGVGGALSVDTPCAVQVVESKFINNKAPAGGAISLQDFGYNASCQPADAAFLSKVTLVGNAASSGDGGALLVQTSALPVNVKASAFSKNTAAANGGAVAAVDSVGQGSMVVSKSQFKGNSALLAGGAISLIGGDNATLTIASSNMSSNTALSGGALRISGGASLDSSHSLYTANTAQISGGAVECNGCDSVMTDADIFSANTAKHGNGGAITCVNCGTFDATSTNVTANTAVTAGGFYLGGSEFAYSTILHSNFTHNNATGPANPNNEAVGGGGGVANLDGWLYVSGSRFTDNAAAAGGGAVLLDPTCPAEVNTPATCTFVAIDTSEFDGNTATQAGGILYSTSPAIPASLACGTKTNAAAASYNGDLGALPTDRGFAVPSECAATFENNTATGYGNDAASNAYRLVLTPDTILGARSDTKIAINVTVVDQLGQIVGSSALGVDIGNNLLIQASSYELGVVDQSKAETFNGTAFFTAMTLKGKPRPQAYTVTFTAANANAVNITPANLPVVIRPCVPGEYGLGDDCQACAIDSYSFVPSIPCLTCPINGLCAGNATFVPAPGYWHSAANSTEIHNCPKSKACSYNGREDRLLQCQQQWYAANLQTTAYGGNLTLDQSLLDCQLWGVPATSPQSYMLQQCAEGYTGNLCGVCDKNPQADGSRYGFYAPFKCNKCKSEALVISLILIGFFAQFIFVIFTIWSNIQTNQDRYITGESQPSDYIKPFVLYLQYNYISTKLGISWPEWIYDALSSVQLLFGSGGGGVFSVDCLFNSTSNVPLKRAAIDIAIPFGLALFCLIFWLMWWRFVLPWVKKRNGGLNDIITKARCAGIEIPVVQSVDDQIIHLGSCGSGSSELGVDLEKVVPSGPSKTGESFISVRSAKDGEVHTTSLNSILKVIDDEKKRSFTKTSEREAALRRVLSLEVSIQMQAETFPQYLKRLSIVSALVIAFFVYPTLCQAILGVFSCYNIDTIDLGSAYPYTPLATWGHGYWQQNMDQECYTGEHLVAIWAIGIPGTIIFCLGIPLAGFLVMFRHRHELHNHHVAATYGFLYHQYKEKFWYWNAIEQLRLLVLVLVAVFGRTWTPFVQLHAFIMVLLISVALSLWLKPLRYAARLEVVSLGAFAIIMFLSLYFVDYQQEPSQELVNTLAVIILVINVSAIVLMIIMIIRANVQHFKRWGAIVQEAGKGIAASAKSISQSLGSMSSVQRKEIRRVNSALRRQQKAAAGMSDKPNMGAPRVMPVSDDSYEPHEMLSTLEESPACTPQSAAHSVALARRIAGGDATSVEVATAIGIMNDPPLQAVPRC